MSVEVTPSIIEFRADDEPHEQAQAYLHVANNLDKKICYRIRVSVQHIFVVPESEGYVEAGCTKDISILMKYLAQYPDVDVSRVKFAFEYCAMEEDNNMPLKDFIKNAKDMTRISVLCNIIGAEHDPILHTFENVNISSQFLPESKPIAVELPNEPQGSSIDDSAPSNDVHSGRHKRNASENSVREQIDKLLGNTELERLSYSTSVKNVNFNGSINSPKRSVSFNLPEDEEIVEPVHSSVSVASSLTAVNELSSEPRGHVLEMLIKNVSRDSVLTDEEVNELKQIRAALGVEAWEEWLIFARTEKHRRAESGEYYYKPVPTQFIPQIPLDLNTSGISYISDARSHAPSELLLPNKYATIPLRRPHSAGVSSLIGTQIGLNRTTGSLDMPFAVNGHGSPSRPRSPSRGYRPESPSHTRPGSPSKSVRGGDDVFRNQLGIDLSVPSSNYSHSRPSTSHITSSTPVSSIVMANRLKHAASHSSSTYSPTKGVGLSGTPGRPGVFTPAMHHSVRAHNITSQSQEFNYDSLAGSPERVSFVRDNAYLMHASGGGGTVSTPSVYRAAAFQSTPSVGAGHSMSSGISGIPKTRPSGAISSAMVDHKLHRPVNGFVEVVKPVPVVGQALSNRPYSAGGVRESGISGAVCATSRPREPSLDIPFVISQTTRDSTQMPRTLSEAEFIPIPSAVARNPADGYGARSPSPTRDSKQSVSSRLHRSNDWNDLPLETFHSQRSAADGYRARSPSPTRDSKQSVSSRLHRSNDWNDRPTEISSFTGNSVYRGTSTGQVDNVAYRPKSPTATRVSVSTNNSRMVENVSVESLRSELSSQAQTRAGNYPVHTEAYPAHLPRGVPQSTNSLVPDRQPQATPDYMNVGGMSGSANVVSSPVSTNGMVSGYSRHTNVAHIDENANMASILNATVLQKQLKANLSRSTGPSHTNSFISTANNDNAWTNNSFALDDGQNDDIHTLNLSHGNLSYSNSGISGHHTAPRNVSASSERSRPAELGFSGSIGSVNRAIHQHNRGESPASHRSVHSGANSYTFEGVKYDRAQGSLARVVLAPGCSSKVTDEFPVRVDSENHWCDVVWRENKNVPESKTNTTSVLRRERFRVDDVFAGASAIARYSAYCRLRTRQALLYNKENLTFLCVSAGENTQVMSRINAGVASTVEPPAALLLGEAGGSGIISTVVSEIFETLPYYYIQERKDAPFHAKAKSIFNGMKTGTFITVSTVLFQNDRITDMFAMEPGKGSKVMLMPNGSSKLSNITQISISNLNDFERIVGTLISRCCSTNGDDSDDNTVASTSDEVIPPSLDESRLKTMLITVTVHNYKSIIKRNLHVEGKNEVNFNFVCPVGSLWSNSSSAITMLMEAITCLPHKPPASLLEASSLTRLLVPKNPKLNDFVAIVYVNRRFNGSKDSSIAKHISGYTEKDSVSMVATSLQSLRLVGKLAGTY